MQKQQRLKYEMLLRVQDFGIAHRELFPETSIGGQAFKELAEATARIDAHVQTRPPANDGRKEKAVAREAVKAAMRAIVRTAKGIERAPGTINTLVMPKGSSDVAVLAAARRLGHDAEAVKDQLAELGLEPACLSDLAKAVDVFDATIRACRAGRSNVAGSEGGIQGMFRLAFKALRTIDIVVANAVKDDPVLVAAWARDREVVGLRSSKARRAAESSSAVEPPATPEPTTSAATTAPPDDGMRKAS